MKHLSLATLSSQDSEEAVTQTLQHEDKTFPHSLLGSELFSWGLSRRWAHKKFLQRNMSSSRGYY